MFSMKSINAYPTPDLRHCHQSGHRQTLTLLLLLSVLVLSGCQTAGGTKGIFDLESLSIGGDGQCRPYNSDVYHGDKVETETGQACRNEDGTWKPAPKQTTP